MPKKIIKLNKEALKKLKSGVDQAVDCIKISYGPSGINAILGRAYQQPEITNDGKTIADDIYLDDEIEQLAADKIKAVTRSQFEKTQDGTTTATILCGSIADALYSRLTVDSFTTIPSDPIVLRKELDIVCEKICTELTKRAEPVITKEDMYKIAYVSYKNEKIAKLISEMFFELGKDAVITVEDGYLELEHETIPGFEIESGLIDDDFANQDDKTFIIEKPHILVTNQTLQFKEQVFSLTQKLGVQGIRNLIIISDNFSKEIIKSFLIAKLTEEFNIIPIKAPYFGKKEKMEDIAIALGCTFIDKDKDMDIGNAEVGKPAKIVISKDRTLITGAKGITKDRIKELQSELKKCKSKFDKEQLEKRIGKLTGSIGVIRVGDDSDTNVGYSKKKILNAVNSTKNALQEGAIPGGGLALKDISETMPKNILTDALLSPYTQLQSNAGGNLKIGPEILDPVKNIKNALKAACTEMGLLFTCGVAIADKYEKPTDFKEVED